MADLWSSLAGALLVALVKFLSEIFSVSFLCSAILTPNCLPVSPMYTSTQWLHGILYTTASPVVLLANLVLRLYQYSSEDGVRFYGCGFSMFGENALYFLPEFERMDVWDNYYSSWFFLCIVFVVFALSSNFLPVHLFFSYCPIIPYYPTFLA